MASLNSLKYFKDISIKTKQIQQDMTELLSRQQFSLATSIADDIDSKIKLRIEILKANAGNISQEQLVDPRKVRGNLKGRYALNSLFKNGVVLISSDGKGIADYPEVPGRIDFKFRGREYFDDVMVTG